MNMTHAIFYDVLIMYFLSVTSFDQISERLYMFLLPSENICLPLDKNIQQMLHIAFDKYLKTWSDKMVINFPGTDL